MGDDVKQLAQLLADKIKPQTESSLTIKWAAVISILVFIFGGLFAGYVSNATRITHLEANQIVAVQSIKKIEDAQIRIEQVINEIRLDQIRSKGFQNGQRKD
jgi:hypothetical protein